MNLPDAKIQFNDEPGITYFRLEETLMIWEDAIGFLIEECGFLAKEAENYLNNLSIRGD